jgi:prepilin-type N-terminal cleavage/methylation domain-containing protein
MKIPIHSRRGMTLIELSVTSGLIGVLGLIIYSLLNIGTILGAKNTAVNTAHQQARVAMLQMVQDLHAAISLPYLIDVDINGNVVMDASGAVPALTTGPASGPAAGIAFQQWSMGPLEIIADTAPLPPSGISQNFVRIKLPSSTSPRPAVNQRLIVPTHQIEGDITDVSGPWDNVRITLANIPAPSPAPSPSPPPGTLPVQILGTSSALGDVVCFITDRCWYAVTDTTLLWHKQGDRVMVNDITQSKPFSTPTTAGGGALFYRFVAAIDLSTSDLNYSNRGFKSANILLNGQVPLRARLTTYQ